MCGGPLHSLRLRSYSHSLGEALHGLLHHHCHHVAVLSELIHYLVVLLDQEGADVTELNLC